MKKKTFILTLMMMLCSIAFGQHWTMEDNVQYNGNMSIISVVQIDGTEQTNADIELAAFHNGTLRGVVKPFEAIDPNGQARFVFQLTIHGTTDGEKLNFKIYVPGVGNNEGKEYDTDYTVYFKTNDVIWGDYNNYEPLPINFYERHWSSDVTYENNMTVGCTIKINGVVQERTDLEIAAFCGDVVRGVAKPVYWAGPNIYFTSLIIGGNNGDKITFKLYDPILDEELSTEYTVTFVKDAMIGEDTPLAIDFLSSSFSYVAQIGNEKYVSFDAALEAAQDGDDIVLLENISLTETAVLSKDINVSLNNNTVTGTIELANTGATVTGAQDAVTSVITNIADQKVVYENGMYKVVAKVYVAQVGTTKYETLEAAIAAAQSGETVTVLANVELAETLTIAAEKNFTLDLNGKNITATNANANLDIYGNLTIEDKIGGGVSTFRNHKVSNGGSLTLTSGTLQNISTNTGGYGIYVTEGGSATINGGTVKAVNNSNYAICVEGNLTVNAGTIVGNHGVIAVENANAVANINNGKYILKGVSGSSDHLIYIPAGKINIAGGNFTCENLLAEGDSMVWVENDGLAISGGTFSSPIEESWCAAGYIPTQFTDGTYGVKAGSYIAQIGTTKYETFEEAYEAAQADDVIELFRTVVLTSNYNYEKQVTVKSAFGETAFRVKAEVSFNNMTINSDDYCVIVGASDGAGKLTINGGTYNGETTAVSVTMGEVNINGGTFKVEPYQGSYEYTINCIDANYNNGAAKVSIQGGKFYKFNPMNNAAEGTGTNFCAEGYEARYNQNDDTYFVRRKPSGHVAYRADVTDKADREGIAILLKEVFAIESLVVKVYNGETLMFTSTRREQDLDDEKNVLFPVDGNTTANIVLWGKESGSWINEIHVAPTELNVPNKIEVYADGVLVDTYTHESGTVLGTNLEKYIALECVKKAVAKIGETKYMTLAEAVTAAQTGETITVLANVETTSVTLPENVTLDLNGKTVKADIIGKINTNGGLWTTPQGYKMIGNGADYYQTTDATIVMGANYSIEMLSGTVSLVPNVWYTLDRQNITIKQDATFNINADQTFVINGSTVENNGTVNNAGTIQILEGATVKGVVTGNLHFKGGNYITAEDFNMVGKVGDSDYYYNTNNATINIAANGDITIASGDMTLGKSWRTLPGQIVTVAEGATFTVPSDKTYQIYGTAIVNGTLTVNGTVEIAALEATLKAQEGLNVITNIEGYKVVYENGTYSLATMDAYFKGGAYARYVASKDREHFSITLGEVYAKESLVVKVYSGETLLLTTTYRAEDLDNPGVNRYPVISDKLTVNNVVSGKEAGSWLNEYAQGIELTIANVPDKFEVYADGVLKDTYDGTQSELKGFGSEKDLNTYLGFEGVYKAASITNTSGTEYYMTLAEALADVKEGDVLNLHDDATIANPINVTSNLTINGNNHTLTYTGANRAIDVTAGNFTAENLTIVANGERGINYNVANGQLTLNNVEVEGTSTYALNLPGLSDGAKVVINNSSLTGKIALNVWGENTTITTTNSHFTSVDETEAEDYAAIAFNNDGNGTSCAGTTIVMDGGSIIAKDQNGNPSVAVSNSAAVNFEAGVNYNVNNATRIVGEIKTPVAIVTYEGQNAFYSCYTFQEAIDEAIETKGSVKLLTNVASSEIITINGKVKIDGNGKTLTSTATRAINVATEGEVNISNLIVVGTDKTERAINVIEEAANLTLNNVKAEGFKYTINVAASSVGSEIKTNGGKFSGYAAVNITGDNTTFTSNETEFVGVNNVPAGTTNAFAAIVIGDYVSGNTTDDVVVTINGGNVTSTSANGNAQSIVQVTAAKDAQVTVKAALSLCNENVFYTDCINEVIAKFPADYADELNAQGYATSTPVDGLVTVLGDAVAEIVETGVNYATLAEAVTAATSGQTIVLLANVETTSVTLPENVTLDLNGKTVKADIIGTVKTNGGLWITSTGHKMLGSGADIYATENATVINSAKEVNIVSGAITLAATEWWTLQNQNLTIGSGATFTIPATSKFNVMNGTTVTVKGAAINNGTLVIYGTAIVDGTITVNGTVELATLTATLKAQEGLNVITNIEDKAVAYENGIYEVVQAVYEQRRTLGAGWNWFSSYINISGEEGLEAIETALGTSGLQIKGQLGFVDYSSEWGWNGTLVSASVEEMFMIQTSEQVELVLTGKLANPATPITLQKNWTYIGYPVSEPMNLKDALANITPNDGDIIKTHNGEVAQYYAESNTWYTQSLQSMTPGLGYMYRNTSGVTKTLVYPTPNANTRAEVRANVTSENNHWLPNASAFANNMNIIAVLESNDMMGEFEVAAFVNGEVRGSARPTYVEPIDAYVLFMTIYGEEGEEMTFKYYDIYSDEEHSINNTVNYSDNAVIGSIKEPYMFFANTLGMDENAANTLSLYPNPTTTNAAISFETIYDIVEVFNSLGAKVAEYRNVDRIEGMEAAGVYVIRVTNDNAVQNCRLIVK